MPAANPLRVTVWGENVHENHHEGVKKVYPDGMHTVVAEGLKEMLGDSVAVRTATLQEPEHGLTEEVLDQTDVLTWWGHAAHNQVDDAIVDRVYGKVLDGMGLIALHSAHFSKIFVKLMGTRCSLRWREAGEKERLWCVNPGHPITHGLEPYFELQHTEMYGELFDIPAPEELIFISWFAGGEVFRSGCCWTRGKGKIFYFRPGHETFPIYFDPNVRRVIANGVQYVAQKSDMAYYPGRLVPNIPDPLEKLDTGHEVDPSLHDH